MKIWTKITAISLLLDGLFLFSACGGNVEIASVQTKAEPTIAVETNLSPQPSQTPKVPNLQSELLDERNKTTASPFSAFDFKNFTYELPRGWQNADGEITLENGKSPVSLAEEERNGRSCSRSRSCSLSLSLSLAPSPYRYPCSDPCVVE